MSDSVIVRPLAAAELEAYLEHMMRLDGNARAIRFAAGVDDHYLLSHCLTLVVSRTQVIGAFVAGELRGAAEIEVDDDGAVAEIFLAVEKAWRGQRIGHALVEEALGEARRRRIGRIRIDVDAGNEAAHRIAVANGFSRAGGRRTVTYELALAPAGQRPAAQKPAEAESSRWWNPFRAAVRTA